MCDSIRIQYERGKQRMSDDVRSKLRVTQRDGKDVWAGLTGGRKQLGLNPMALRECRAGVDRIKVVLDKVNRRQNSGGYYEVSEVR